MSSFVKKCLLYVDYIHIFIEATLLLSTIEAEHPLFLYCIDDLIFAEERLGLRACEVRSGMTNLLNLTL